MVKQGEKLTSKTKFFQNCFALIRRRHRTGCVAGIIVSANASQWYQKSGVNRQISLSTDALAARDLKTRSEPKSVLYHRGAIQAPLD